MNAAYYIDDRAANDLLKAIMPTVESNMSNVQDLLFGNDLYKISVIVADDVNGSCIDMAFDSHLEMYPSTYGDLYCVMSMPTNSDGVEKLEIVLPAAIANNTILAYTVYIELLRFYGFYNNFWYLMLTNRDSYGVNRNVAACYLTTNENNIWKIISSEIVIPDRSVAFDPYHTGK